MKKLIIASLVALAPAIASAQVQLISGFNFGQFIGLGVPATNGLTGDPVGFIQSNFGPNTIPGPTDSGVFHGNNSIPTPYSAGSSTLYFNGTNSSSAFDFTNGTNVSVIERGSGITVNNQTVNPIISMALAGDSNNAGLLFNSSVPGVNQFSILTNTTGFLDFDPLAQSQPNDFNFTFASYAYSGGSGTVQFSFNGSPVGGSFAVNGGEYQAFNLDLPGTFYGNSAATLVATVSGNLAFDHIQINGELAAIPEPSTYAAILGAVAFGFVARRRRQLAAS